MRSHSLPLRPAAAAIAALALAPVAFAGPDWVEDGDAGADLATAQPINVGVGPTVQRIFGSLTGTPLQGNGDFVDVYQILVSDPLSLHFSTVDTTTNFQTSLWLFDEKGFGLLGNVIAPTPVAGELQGSELFNFSTDGTGIFIKTPGIYYIAICGVGRVPVSGGNQMFFFGESDEISGPDGEGGGGTLGGWSGDGAIGSYEILVDGVSFIPAPGALALVLIGGPSLATRRRR